MREPQVPTPQPQQPPPAARPVVHLPPILLVAAVAAAAAEANSAVSFPRELLSYLVPIREGAYRKGTGVVFSCIYTRQIMA